MRELTKNQIRVIVALNIVVVVLFFGLMFNFSPKESNASTNPIDNQHDVNRNARISLNIDLDFETNIGGSLDDELISAFSSPDQASLHIFGNTSSRDLDFSGANGGIFFVETNKKGKIENIYTYGEEGDILRFAVIAEGGYLLAIENNPLRLSYLLHVAYNGSVLKKITHTSINEEKIADLVLMENCYALIVHYGIASIDFYDIKVFFYTLDLIEDGVATLHSSAYSLEYIYILPKGLNKYIMAVNNKSELWNGMSVVEFSQGTSLFKNLQIENNYVAKGFMPWSDGYVALIIDESGFSSVLTLSSSFNLKEKKYLSASTLDAKLLFANENYYVFIKNAEKTSMFKFDSLFVESESIYLFKYAESVASSYIRAENVFFSCEGEYASFIMLSKNQDIYKSFGGDGQETNTKLVFLDGDMFIICETQRNGGDVGENFGGKDIWLAKVSD